MKKTVLRVFDLVLVSVLIANCSTTTTPVSNPTPSIIPTSTRPAPKPSLPFTATVVPSATPAAELPISTEAAAYLEEALDIMQNKSLHRHSIDWDIIRTSAFEVARHAQTPADTYGAIRYALVRLGDHHSHFLTPESHTQVQEMTANDNPPPRGKLLLDKVGFISIEGFGGFDGEAYATQIQDLIRELDGHNPCGWIVDLRENTGGNMWPMLAGLGPILGEGKAGTFVDADGQKVDWFYQDGRALLESEIQAEVEGSAYRLTADSPPVAVLTGPSTASSGEAIAVSFRGRPNTRSFGRYTTGLSTANSAFPLPDGALIVLTTAVFADRTGQTYGDRIYPDELVDDVRKFTFLMDEAIPQPAIDWLMSHPACLAQTKA
jgi:C-terminal processing protease CtpA/Prc